MIVAERRLPERKMRLLEHIGEAGGLMLSSLPKTVLRDIYSLAKGGFVKIDRGTARLTQAGRQAIRETPELKRVRLAVRNGEIVLGSGSEGYILKTGQPPPAKRRDGIEDKRAAIDRARRLLLQGKTRYAAITLLRAAETEEEKERVKRLIERPDPRGLRYMLRYFMEKLGGTRRGRDSDCT